MVNDDREDREDHLGTAAELLLEQGDRRAAALLLDVVRLDYIYIDLAWGRGEERVTMVAARLHVPVAIIDRFDEETCRAIHGVLQQVAIADELFIRDWSDIRIVPAPSEGNWRERVERNLAGSPTNQATLAPLGDRHPREDRMSFRDAAELALYRALKRFQEAASPQETITIAPNASVRLPGRTLEPDFLIAFRGRIGLIEVDGPAHTRRAAADRSRDRLFEDAGIAYIERIVVEDTDDPEAVDGLVHRFIRRLGEKR